MIIMQIQNYARVDQESESGGAAWSEGVPPPDCPSIVSSVAFSVKIRNKNEMLLFLQLLPQTCITFEIEN